MIAVSSIGDFAGGKQLWQEWEGLCARIGSRCTVFCTPEWYECWWNHFGGGERLQVLVVREDGELLGIAPLMIQKKHFRGLPARVLGFLENGNSLHNDFIILPGREKEVLESIFAYLFENSRSLDLIELANLSVESGNYPVLTNMLRTLDSPWGVKEGLDSPYIPVCSDWEGYFSQRTVRTRKTLRQICNKVDKAGQWQVKRIERWEDYVKVRDAVFEVARRSWSEKEADSLGSDKNKGFFEELSLVASRKGWLNLWTLVLNGELIAFEYHLKYGKTIHGMRSSFAEEYSSLSPGAFLDYQIIKGIFETGEDVKEYDLGGSFDRYKKKWTDEIRKHSNFQVFQKCPYSLCLYFYEYGLIRFLRWGRDCLKEIRKTTPVFNAEKMNLFKRLPWRT